MGAITTGILECGMAECSFNIASKCMAAGVNFGGPHQECDTFFKGHEKGGLKEPAAIVGACKVTQCGFNKGLLCIAKNIKVGVHDGHADCTTFRIL
jgi:hypothetical protein